MTSNEQLCPELHRCVQSTVLEPQHEILYHFPHNNWMPSAPEMFLEPPRMLPHHIHQISHFSSNCDTRAYSDSLHFALPNDTALGTFSFPQHEQLQTFAVNECDSFFQLHTHEDASKFAPPHSAGKRRPRFRSRPCEPTKPASLIAYLKTSIVHHFQQKSSPVSEAELETFVRAMWRRKTKELRILDTNATTNWRKLLLEIRVELGGRVVSRPHTPLEDHIPAPTEANTSLSRGVGNEGVASGKSPEMTPALLVQLIKQKILEDPHTCAALEAGSELELQNFLRSIWRLSLKEYRLIDTNSTKNWKRLVQDVKQQIWASRHQPTTSSYEMYQTTAVTVTSDMLANTQTESSDAFETNNRLCDGSSIAISGPHQLDLSCRSSERMFHSYERV